MLEWGPSPREAGPPGPRLSSPGEQERNAVMAIRVGVNILQFCSVSNSLAHANLQIKWEVYFSKDLCRSSLLWRCYDYASAYEYTTLLTNSTHAQKQTHTLKHIRLDKTWKIVKIQNSIINRTKLYTYWKLPTQTYIQRSEPEWKEVINLMAYQISKII